MSRVLLVAAGEPAPDRLVFHHVLVVDFAALVVADVPCPACPVQVGKHTWQLVDDEAGHAVVDCSERPL